MSGISIELDVKDILKDFKNFTPDVQKNVKDELRLSGLDIESAYKIAVPVDTGRLRSSIHNETKDFQNFVYTDSTGQKFNGGFSLKAQNELEVLIGTNVEYSEIIEQQGGKNQVGQNALQQAFEQVSEKLPERLGKIIEDKLR